MNTEATAAINNSLKISLVNLLDVTLNKLNLSLKKYQMDIIVIIVVSGKEQDKILIKITTLDSPTISINT